MGIVERDFDVEDIHPIDIVESLAADRAGQHRGQCERARAENQRAGEQEDSQ